MTRSIIKAAEWTPTRRQFKATAETFKRVTPAHGNPYRENDAAQGA